MTYGPVMNELWSRVYEQERAKEVLTRLVQTRRVPHAFLFNGKEGVGKFFTAVQFAKILNSNSTRSPEKNEAIAKRIATLQEPYIKLLIPLPRGKNETGDDSATEKLSADIMEVIRNEIHTKAQNPYYTINIPDANTIKINSVREIRQFVSMTHEDVEYRFILINEAHLLNEQAQNSLLKNLEEPPEGIIFILNCSEKEKLLPTIQSRCWEINFEPLSAKSISDILVEYFHCEVQTADELSGFAEGSVKNAVSFLGDANLKEQLASTISVLRYSFARKYNSAYRELGAGTDQDNIRLLIKMIKIWLSELVKNKFLIHPSFFKDYEDTLSKFNFRYPGIDIAAIYSVLDELEGSIDKNVNLNVLYLNLIFELASLTMRK